MKEETRLENWSVQARSDPYRAPEMLSAVLSGEVWGHPRFSGGHVVRTSNIIWMDLEKMQAKTRSGTLYALGKPAQEFLAWIREQGRRLEEYHMPEK
jgi:hypothetical protein